MGGQPGAPISLEGSPLDAPVDESASDKSLEPVSQSANNHLQILGSLKIQDSQGNRPDISMLEMLE